MALRTILVVLLLLLVSCDAKIKKKFKKSTTTTTCYNNITDSQVSSGNCPHDCCSGSSCGTKEACERAAKIGLGLVLCIVGAAFLTCVGVGVWYYFRKSRSKSTVVEPDAGHPTAVSNPLPPPMGDPPPTGPPPPMGYPEPSAPMEYPPQTGGPPPPVYPPPTADYLPNGTETAPPPAKGAFDL